MPAGARADKAGFEHTARTRRAAKDTRQASAVRS